MAIKYDLTIRRGETFIRTVRWASAPYVFKPITGITQAAPAVVTATAHGVPDGWRVAVVSVKGMTQINAQSTPPRDSEYYKAKVLTANTLQLDGVNAADFKPYTSGGYLQFATPVDMTGYTARMQIRDKVGGTLLLTLTSANGGLTIDTTKSSVTITISATATAGFIWNRGVYDLEMVSADGRVTTIVEGSVKVTPEVTV